MSQWKAHGTDLGPCKVPGHYSDIFDPELFKKLVNETDAALQAINLRVPFDAVATCGLSGNLLGSVLSHQMGIPHIVIRKSCEIKATHHGYSVTGITKGRVLLIDDLIDTGGTIRHMIDRLTTSIDKNWEGDVIERELKVVGVLLTFQRFVEQRYAPHKMEYYPDPEKEAKKWKQSVGTKLPLPVFCVRDVIEDRAWPGLMPAIITHTDVDELPPISLPPISLNKSGEEKPVVAKTVKRRYRKPKGNIVDPPLPPSQYITGSFVVAQDGSITDARGSMAPKKISSWPEYLVRYGDETPTPR